jgi:outer membrane protein assembly factor BamB
MPTTRCCSAFALIAASCFVVRAHSTAVEPLSLFPTRDAWTLPLNNSLTATPALVGNRGYFPIEGDRLAAYDIEHGTLLWVVPARALARPTAGEGLVFIVEPDMLTALDESTGTVTWRVPYSEPLAAPLVWDNGWLIAAAAEGSVLAFRASDGGLIWQRQLDARIHGAAALAADRVYIPLVDGRIVAMQVASGDPLWSKRLGGAPSDILALDEQIFVGSRDNYFYNLRARDGFVTWRFETGADVVGLPVVTEGRVYFVSMDNLLRCLSRRTGGQIWKVRLPLRPVRGPGLAGDALIVSGVSPKAQAYRMDGKPAGEIAAGGEIAGAPHLVPGTSLPLLALVTRDLEAGTLVHAVVRSIDPKQTPIAPLPDSLNAPTPPEVPASK